MKKQRGWEVEKNKEKDRKGNQMGYSTLGQSQKNHGVRNKGKTSERQKTPPQQGEEKRMEVICKGGTHLEQSNRNCGGKMGDHTGKKQTKQKRNQGGETTNTHEGKTKKGTEDKDIAGGGVMNRPCK